MISPTLKDDLLKYMIASSPDMQFAGNRNELAEQFNTSKEVIKAILEQFHKKGYIQYRPFRLGQFQCGVTADAHDYILKGGHTGEFEFLEMQIQKLKNELYAFESAIPQEKFSNAMATINLILAAATSYRSFK
jgi:hypothetical protein